MRKLIVAVALCLAVGGSGTAFARGGGGGGNGAGGGGGTLFIPGGGGGSTASHATASGQPAGGVQANRGSQHDNVATFGTTTIGNTSGIGTETVNGQTIVGTVQGQSGASGSPGPFFPVLLGPDKGTTSKREACPGWMQTSGLDYCIRPQDQLRPQDVRR